MTRRAAERRGRGAETLAALWLMAKGYRLLARRARTGFGEIDIVALKGRTLAIVEVKARTGVDAALQAIGLRQRERLARAALAFAGRLARPDLRLRFDVVVVTPWRLPRHFAGAWIEGDRP